MRYRMLTEAEGLDMYRDFLDETCEPVEVAGYQFMPSKVLEEMDPVAFNEGFQSYAEACVDSGILIEDYTDGYYDPELDVDAETDDGYALASAGFGTDEDYGQHLAEDY